MGLRNIRVSSYSMVSTMAVRGQITAVTYNNPTGNITNSNLKMVADVLGWLVLEAVVST